MKILPNFPMFGAFLGSLFTVMYNRQKRATRRFAAKSLPKLLTLIAILGALMVVDGCGDPLGYAARSGNISKIRRYLDKGGDINAREQGWTLLHWAVTGAGSGQMKVVRFLINRGADVNAGTEVETSWLPIGRTPLMMASSMKHTEIMKLLIERGADVDARDSSGLTALLILLRQGSKSDIENAYFLLNKGCRLPEIPPYSAGLLAPILPVWILELNGSKYKEEFGIISLSPGLCTVKVDYHSWNETGWPITLEFNAKAGHLYVIAHEVLKGHILKGQKLYSGDKWQAWFLELKP